MMDSPVVGAVASVEARLTSGLRCRRKHTATNRLKGQLALRVAHMVLGIVRRPVHILATFVDFRQIVMSQLSQQLSIRSIDFFKSANFRILTR
jgi:hypothetical protein